MIFGLQGKRLHKVTKLSPDFIVHCSRGEPFLSIQTASFTYGDSMFSMCENYRQKLGHE
jgi:hypothetical protein